LTAKAAKTTPPAAGITRLPVVDAGIHSLACCDHFSQLRFNDLPLLITGSDLGLDQPDTACVTRRIACKTWPARTLRLWKLKFLPLHFCILGLLLGR
jgi:hypothetical protein